MDKIYLNGDFIAKEAAKISVLDRGFLFGDGIYEGIPLYQGIPFGLDEHFMRLERSLAAIAIPNPLPLAEWKALCRALLEENRAFNSDSWIYIQITRGVATTRQHEFRQDLKPTVMMMLKPLSVAPQSVQAQGFKAICREDRRREDCYIKSINLLPNVLMYQEAQKEGAFETILIRHHYAVEATQSNLFIVKENRLITPPLSPHILAGVTRHFVLKFAKMANITTLEEDIPEARLRAADELWVTGSNKEICPIITLDNQPVGNGRVGPVWHTINKIYQQEKRRASNAWSNTSAPPLAYRKPPFLRQGRDKNR